MNYGSGFPYFNESIIAANECLSCMDQERAAEQQNNNGNNNGNNNYYYQYNDDQYQYKYYNAESNEMCMRATEEANYRCDYKNGYSRGCTFINTTLPCLDGRGCPKESSSSSKSDKDNDSSSSGSFIENGTTSTGSLSSIVTDFAVTWFNENKIEAVIGGGIVVALVAIMAIMYMCKKCGPSSIERTKGSGGGRKGGLPKLKLLSNGRKETLLDKDRQRERELTAADRILRERSIDSSII